MSDMNLLVDYYKTAFLSVKQCHAHGKPNMAKPILIISLIEAIEKGKIKENKILFVDLLEHYTSESALNGWHNKTSLQLPFYFMGSEPFWHLKWVAEPVKTKSPSAKFIRENVEYAYLDNALWDLLQDAQVRGRLRDALMSHFLSR